MQLLPSLLSVLVVLEAASRVVQASLDPIIQLGMTLDTRSSCFYLPRLGLLVLVSTPVRCAPPGRAHPTLMWPLTLAPSPLSCIPWFPKHIPLLSQAVATVRVITACSCVYKIGRGASLTKGLFVKTQHQDRELRKAQTCFSILLVS